MLGLLAKLIKILNSEQSPKQLATAISMAAIIGITPLFSLHNLLILLLVLFFRVNLSLFLLMWPLFSLLGLLVNPLSLQLGQALLQAEAIQPFWQGFYNTLAGRWSNFYFTGVIGSLLLSLTLAVLLFPLSLFLIHQYRDKLQQKLGQIQLVKLLKATRFWQLYQGN